MSFFPPLSGYIEGIGQVSCSPYSWASWRGAPVHREDCAAAPERPGHGITFDWAGLDRTGA